MYYSWVLLISHWSLSMIFFWEDRKKRRGFEFLSCAFAETGICPWAGSPRDPLVLYAPLGGSALILWLRSRSVQVSQTEEQYADVLFQSAVFNVLAALAGYAPDCLVLTPRYGSLMKPQLR